MIPTLVIAAAVFLIAGLWLLATYNRLVRLRQHIAESWADIEVELVRRYELIPNLVETVRGYAAHEQAVLERVIELRNVAAASTGPADAQGRDETSLMLEVKRLFALVESYPDLKADRHFLDLQKELALTEDRIAAARRFFNGNVRDLNTMCEAFPSSIVASSFGFAPSAYFELADDAARVVPSVAGLHRNDA